MNPAAPHPTKPTPRAPRARKLLNRTPVWAVVGVVTLIALSAVTAALGSATGRAGTILFALVSAVAAVPVYRWVMVSLARRGAPELTRDGAVRDLLQGAALGAAFVLTSVLLVAALGGYTLHWHAENSIRVTLTVLAVSIGAAVTEELVFRGVMWHAIERAAGRWTALAVTALFFGVAHLFNPAATLWSATAIVIEAGILTGAAFMWRRSLWLVIGLHAAWNTIEGLLGIPISGHREPGLFVTTLHGNDALTGGSFGLEASVVPVLVSLAIAVPMLVKARRDPGRDAVSC